MEYTVQKLSRLSGVSPRALRYYDEIGLLKPARINSSGYRIYGQAQVAKLQQILFYRELDVSLENIKEIINAPQFRAEDALARHREKLLEKRGRLDRLIANLEKTLAAMEGGAAMSDEEKFAGFKEKLIQENEAKYGKEIREKYGEVTVSRSNKKVRDMSEEQYAEVTRLGEEVLETLQAAFETGDPAGEPAQKAADLHRRWLCYFWTEYTKEAHRGVAQMYVDDARFTAYYDKRQPGLAAFLRDAVFIYTLPHSTQ